MATDQVKDQRARCATQDKSDNNVTCSQHPLVPKNKREMDSASEMYSHCNSERCFKQRLAEMFFLCSIKTKIKF